MNRYTRKGKLRILLFGIALFLLNSKTTMADENREGFRAVFDAEYITASLKLGTETEVTEGQPQQQQQEIEEGNEPVENKASGPAGDRQEL